MDTSTKKWQGSSVLQCVAFGLSGNGISECRSETGREEGGGRLLGMWGIVSEQTSFSGQHDAQCRAQMQAHIRIAG